MKATLDLEELIKVVAAGGVVRTGVDIYNKEGVLLLERDEPVREVSVLNNLKRNGVTRVFINPKSSGGIWDSEGRLITLDSDEAPKPSPPSPSVEMRLKEIGEIRRVAALKYEDAKNCITQVIADIRATGGEFDFSTVERTTRDLLDFLTRYESAFSYLTKELFSYDNYLYTHAINVCTIGCAILSRFNRHFSRVVNQGITLPDSVRGKGTADSSFSFFLPEDLHHIAIGFFLHDIGKVLIPEEVLNKSGRLSAHEFDLVKTHSYLRGREILRRNGCDNPYILNCVMYHHGLAFPGDTGCYPLGKNSADIPIYVKICKLADIYDAMTSKRSYKDAVNPIGVVTEIFRKFEGQDNMLQFVLHSFVKSIGIYPPGSIASFKNGQFVYVLDSEGPLVIPFTDTNGNTLAKKADPLDLASMTDEGAGVAIDNAKPLISPRKAYASLPDYLKV